MTTVTIPEAQQIISETNIDNVIFSQCPQKRFSLDIKSFNFIKKIENFKIDDLISFLDTLTETLNIEENIQKNKKENTLSYKDITSKDSQNYYMGKENDTITVSRPSYIASRVCSAAIYATCKTFKEATKCASKTLKRNYKKNI